MRFLATLACIGTPTLATSQHLQSVGHKLTTLSPVRATQHQLMPAEGQPFAAEYPSLH